MALITLKAFNKIRIVQRRELAELLGFESRNKYEVCAEDGRSLGFVSEQGSGILHLILRNFLGHWRAFELHIFDNQQKKMAVAHNPFRIYFSEINVVGNDGTLLGTIKKQFSVFSKKFEISVRGGEIFTVSSPIWKIWTFPVLQGETEIACVRKKWSGSLKEIFLDADNFEIEFLDDNLSVEARTVLLAAGVYVDIQYFERKAGE